jgi:hypothetical protein
MSSRLSYTDMAKALQWLYGSGEPNKSKVQRALKVLETDRLAKKRRDHWEPTKGGKRKAEGLPPDTDTVEAPF